jgi:D-alanine--poly(phosphoribitol) ligase subunit 1
VKSEPPELGELLCASFERFHDLPALWLSGKLISYARLFAAAAEAADAIMATTEPGERVGILAQSSFPAYVGILASILSGRPYVPINMKFPFERQLSIASISGCSLLIADDYSRKRCGELLERLGDQVREAQIVDSGDDEPQSLPDFRSHRFVGKFALAYIIFTSGTTGTPKGVAVRRDNVASYLHAIKRYVPIEPGTRCTHLFDLSFDPSVHDLLHTWVNGGCLYVMDREDTLDPVGFARRHALQSWCSVPSVVAMAGRMRRLSAGILPHMQFSMFCGEALPVSLAEEWAKVAPNSRIINSYGPTETTIVITAGEYVPGKTDPEYPATVPLGTIFEDCAAVIVDESGNPATVGELWLGGALIADGYINNAEETAKKFVKKTFPGYRYDRWYRSGDLVRSDSRYGFVFQGRIDDQVKIQGYRIELLEIEEVLRRVCGSSEAAATPWPMTDAGSAEGIVAFVNATAKTEREIIAGCRSLLPSYMTPRQIIFVENLPLNANGKVDRNALRRQLSLGKKN